MATGTLYTYPESFKANRALIAAQYSGFKLTVDKDFKYGETNKTEAFLKKFPTGKVPAFETSDGLCLNEANAIAYYVANTQLHGGPSREDAARVSQWVHFTDNEILPAVCTWVFPCMGVMQYNKQNTAKAQEEVKAVLAVLNDALATKTFLVGERVSLADIVVATTLQLAYELVLEPAVRDAFPNTNRWFTTVVNQSQYKAVVPSVNLCTKMAQFDAKKFAEMSGAANKKKDQPKKEAKKEQAKKETKKEEAPAAAEEPAAPVKKEKDLFLAFPAGTFVMDEWKRVYSNEDTEKIALPWFFENFDPEHYSIWHGDYIFIDSIQSPPNFVNMNLITGMMQRLDKLRKHGFGNVFLFDGPERKSISGLWISRGPELPFTVDPDLGIDYPSYTWTKLDYSDEATKKKIREYWLWEGDFDGRNVYDARTFK